MPEGTEAAPAAEAVLNDAQPANDDAEKAPAEVAPEAQPAAEKPPEPPPLQARALALIAQKEAAIKKREAELERKLQSLKPLEELSALAKSDADAALQRLGIDPDAYYQRRTDKYLGTKKDETTQAVEQRLRSEFQAQLDALKQQQMHATWSGVMAEAMVEGAKVEYESMRAYYGDDLDTVAQEIAQYRAGILQQTGRRLTSAEAASILEAEADRRLTKALEAPKYRAKYQGAKAPAAPPGTSKPAQGTRTLTTSTAAPPATQKALDDLPADEAWEALRQRFKAR